MTSRATRVSVPGKLILMGEHSAVYGRPAVVAAVGLRLRVDMRPTGGEAVELDLPDLDTRRTVPWSEIDAATRRARDLWEAFAASPSPRAFARLRPDGPTGLVMLALGEAAAHVETPGGGERRARGGLALQIRSELPTGAGFGSSAAVSVGVVTAYLATLGAEHGWSVVERVSLEVERRQHGFPSGIDCATVYHGGVVDCLRADDRLEVTPLAAAPELLRGIRVLDTGTPAESTGTVVADVRARRDRDPTAFDRRLDDMAAATGRFRRALVEADSGALHEAVRTYQAALVELGVVPRTVRELVARVESDGGVAKISGAGALSGRSAGCLLVFHHARDYDLEGEGLRSLDAPLGAEGVRLESVA